MEGNNRIPWNTFDNHQVYPATHIASGPMPPPPMPPTMVPIMPPPVPPPMPPPMPHVEMQHVEIHRLLDENWRLVEDRISLQQELADTRDQHEIECKELMERGLQLINDLPAIERLQNEVKHLRSEVTKLCTANQDLSSQVETLQVENEQIPSLRAGIDLLHHELSCARSAAKYENKAKMKLMDQLQTSQKVFDASIEGLEEPSTIQERGIVPIGRGLDVIQHLQYASEKTAAICSEILQQIDYGLVHCQVLFLAPTYERAQHIENLMRALGEHLGVKIHVCVGATSIEEDKHIISAGVHLVVSTPGRVLNMLRRRKPSLRPDHIRMLVLDEADEMLSRGFKDQIYDIEQLLPAKVQVVVLYATRPADALEITRKFTNKPVRILIKFDELTLEDKLRSRGHTVSATDGKMDQKTRNVILREFCSGSSRVLITTDLSARVLDVGRVTIVVNFDLPTQLENYLRRIGRSGEFGSKRYAVNFVTGDDERMLSEIKRFFNVVIDELPSNVVDL
ncbi:hypothetical protein K7X08_023954 [Anisodus acutangulus]|uniref:RNA helicase n=1 Tax=Anisodus acutangulus TaxID=402998 RepID=A0A9Q1M7G4_9SOLA|nr:hypothetical protein K7X08_023954 [Anisodus acutangulus]